MNWTTHINDTDWIIESTAIIDSGTNYFYKWDKSFIRITMKTAGVKTITVEGVKYTMYSMNEYVIIEITEFVRSTSSDLILYFSDDNSFYFVFQASTINGASISEFKSRIPAEIPYIATTNPFWVQLSENMMTKTIVDEIIDYNVTSNPDGGVLSYNWVEEVSHGASLYLYTTTGYYSHFITPSCTTDKILVEWVSAQGKKKSWWFQVERTIIGSDKQLNLQTMENGYNTLKNKRVSIQVSHKNADMTTQTYLSDIAISDEVYIYEGTTRMQVRLADNSFDITQRKRDVQLIINKFAYDTI
jgi:hypothetical protein